MRSRPLDAPPIDDVRAYVGRPGLSPVLAGLVAAGVLAPRMRVLDLGCGRGTDLLALRELGFERLEGVDYNAASLRAARAAERRRLGDSRIVWRHGSLALLKDLDAAAYDVVYETFLLNNLDPDGDVELLRRIARVLRPGGRFLSQRKTWPREAAEPLAAAGFDAGPVVPTHMPERGRMRGRSYEPAAVQVLTRRR